jgi:hypothetical protein
MEQHRVHVLPCVPAKAVPGIRLQAAVPPPSTIQPQPEGEGKGRIRFDYGRRRTLAGVRHVFRVDADAEITPRLS